MLRCWARRLLTSHASMRTDRAFVTWFKRPPIWLSSPLLSLSDKPTDAQVGLFVALKQCCKTRDVELGEIIHREARVQGLPLSLVLQNTLVDLYRKCGCMQQARLVFETMKEKNVVSWNCLILGYVDNGQSQKALDVFAGMDCQPNDITFLAVLKGCAALAGETKSGKTSVLRKGRTIHEQVKEHGFSSSILVSNTLIDMYRKCGDMHRAREVFDSMAEKTTVSWTCLIMGYVDSGEHCMALELFSSMNSEPDHVTCLAALKACTGLAGDKLWEKPEVLTKGLSIHNIVKERGFESDITVANTLVDMYSKCGNMYLARNVFESLQRRDVITWTCLILGYVANGEYEAALSLFSRMDCEPNHVTFTAGLKACTGLVTEKGGAGRQTIFEKGIRFHERIKERGYQANVVVASTLMEMYSKCGEMQLARDVFDRGKNRDVVMWNCLILGYVENEQSFTALEVFHSMDCEPTSVTFLAVLKACSGLPRETEAERRFALERGMSVHEQIKERELDSHLSIASSLVDMYRKSDNMIAAKKVFEKMPYKDVVTWTSLILGYVENGEGSVALDLFSQMDCKPDHLTFFAAVKACISLGTESEAAKREVLEKGIYIHQRIQELSFDSNALVACTLVDLYCKCGSTSLARAVFDRMTIKDIAAWNCLLLGYVENEDSSTALALFTSMDCVPTCITYVTMLKACGALVDLPHGRAFHVTICRLGLEEDVIIATSLVDFYSRCGCMAVATEIFLRMHSPNLVSWNALLTGYSLLGESSMVFTLAGEICIAGLQPDAITYVSILTTCSHAGKVEEGKVYFHAMQKLGVIPTPKHYACMVDLLGRANKLDEAVSLIEKMPYRASDVTWMSLLDACKKWSNVEVGRVAFDALVASGNKEREAAAYVLIRDLYIRHTE